MDAPDTPSPIPSPDVHAPFRRRERFGRLGTPIVAVLRMGLAVWGLACFGFGVSLIVDGSGYLDWVAERWALFWLPYGAFFVCTVGLLARARGWRRTLWLLPVPLLTALLVERVIAAAQGGAAGGPAGADITAEVGLFGVPAAIQAGLFLVYRRRLGIG